jgi:hypothetical protein
MPEWSPLPSRRRYIPVLLCARLPREALPVQVQRMPASSRSVPGPRTSITSTVRKNLVRLTPLAHTGGESRDSSRDLDHMYQPLLQSVQSVTEDLTSGLSHFLLSLEY